MECLIDKNNARCTCTYGPCPRKGRCCECIAYHKKNDELPGCVFSPEAERTYDRSIVNFIRSHSTKAR